MTLARGLQSSGGHMGTRLGITQGCLWTICTDHKEDLKDCPEVGMSVHIPGIYDLGPG